MAYLWEAQSAEGCAWLSEDERRGVEAILPVAAPAAWHAHEGAVWNLVEMAIGRR